MSTTKNEGSSEMLVTGEIDIDSSNKNNNMLVQKEAFTSKNELVKNRRSTSIDAQHEWNDTGMLLMERIEKLGEWPNIYTKNLPEIQLSELFKVVGISENHANALFQIFKLRDFAGKWSEDMIMYGFVFTRLFQSYNREWQVKTQYAYDQLSSHGHEFLLDFFEETKYWFELE